jgi:hypothetical protein
MKLNNFQTIYTRFRKTGVQEREGIKVLTTCFENEFHHRVAVLKQPPKAAFTELNEYWRSLANEFHELNPDGFSRFIRRHETFMEHSNEMEVAA